MFSQPYVELGHPASESVMQVGAVIFGVAVLSVLLRNSRRNSNCFCRVICTFVIDSFDPVGVDYHYKLAKCSTATNSVCWKTVSSCGVARTFTNGSRTAHYVSGAAGTSESLLAALRTCAIVSFRSAG